MRAAAAFAALLVAACSPAPALHLPAQAASPRPGAALAAADAEVWSGRWSEAERDYRRLAGAGDAHGHSHLALLLTYESRLVEAVAEAQEAVREEPDSDTYARLTRALDWSNDLPAALACGAKAVAASPADPMALDFYGEVLSDTARFTDAEPVLRRAEAAARNAHERAEAAREWSNYYRDRGSSVDELNYVEIAAKYEPAFPSRTVELANEYFGAGPGRLVDARTQLDSLVKRYPAEPEVLATAGDAAFNADQTADAERYYRAALARAPGDPMASLGLAEVLVAQDHDPTGARSELLASLRAHPSAEAVYQYLDELDSLVLHIDPARDSPVVPTPLVSGEEQSAYQAVNSQRAELGLMPIKVNTALAEAARAHAYYVLFNWGRSDLSGLGIHSEDSGAPGFTGATSIDRDLHFGYPGYQSAEVINHTLTSAAAVEVWIDSVYHRYPLVGRESADFGYGEAQVGSLAVNVMDVGIGVPQTSTAILYPHNGQTQVPAFFLGNEVPDPAPGAQYPLGYPITVAVGGADALSLKSATLAPLGGAGVPVIIDRPGQAGLNANELAVLPMSPLQPGTIYEVRLQGQLDGRPWSATWSFQVAE
ncbi:MAG TPA: CAP domain-containing protein [Candidatus Dormibacteraeota bacterium]